MCEYFSILFTIKKDKIGKEKTLFETLYSDMSTEQELSPTYDHDAFAGVNK